MTISTKKAEVLEAYRTSRGNVSEACRAVGISRQSFYRWRRNFPNWDEKIRDADEAIVDWVEKKLYENIENGNVTAQIFYLKCKAKYRGYVESEMGGAPGRRKFVNVDGPKIRELLRQELLKRSGVKNPTRRSKSE